MAKSKYNPDTFPLLAEGYARDGLIDEQIAKKLSISIQTFYTYQKKYLEFFQAIKKGKTPVDFEVEKALLKRALGFDYEETHTTIQKNKSGEEIKEVKVITKKAVPDVGAAAFWLKNRLPLKWRDKQDLNINYDNLSDDQLDQILEKLMSKAKQDE